MMIKGAIRSLWRHRIAITKQSALLSVIMSSASLALYGQSLQSLGTSVTIQTEDARATLLALRNPRLTLEKGSINIRNWQSMALTMTILSLGKSTVAAARRLADVCR
jgi:hypothetical protein